MSYYFLSLGMCLRSSSPKPVAMWDNGEIYVGPLEILIANEDNQ